MNTPEGTTRDNSPKVNPDAYEAAAYHYNPHRFMFACIKCDWVSESTDCKIGTCPSCGYRNKLQWHQELDDTFYAIKKVWDTQPKSDIPQVETPGYHLNHIERGVYGELSKIKEEVDEAIDAEKQMNRVMTLCELSDILGALLGYLTKHFPGFTLEDLTKMALATQRAFKNGSRK